ncbi:MAG: hypothetical protein K8U57_02205 [Planctomycetes bacterium]|nr:hypothetical protein [Planctomycetota bacterium]
MRDRSTEVETSSGYENRCSRLVTGVICDLTADLCPLWRSFGKDLLKGMQARPCWSQDGTRLAFTWNRDGKYDLHAVNLNCTGLVRLTDGLDRTDYATYRPDGHSLAFVGEKAGRFDVFSVSLAK